MTEKSTSTAPTQSQAQEASGDRLEPSTVTAPGRPAGSGVAPPSPTVRRRILAAELKKLRRAAGLTHIDVANRLGWQQGKVSKIESAKQAVGIDAVIALADVCQAEHAQRARLVELARAARARGWWESFDDVLPREHRTYVGLESEADAVRGFAVEVVPELLQTRRYATAVVASRAGTAEYRTAGTSAIERGVELLLRRQRSLLEERSARVDLVLAESALRREVGGREVLQEQLRHLAEVSSRPGVTLRVLPFSAGVVPLQCSFSLLEFQAEPHPDVVFVADRAGGTLFEEAVTVESYHAMARELSSRSMSEDDSADFLVAGARELMQ